VGILSAWRLIIPQLSVFAAESASGGLVTSQQANLLAEDRPTMMTRWLISNFRIPFAVAGKSISIAEIQKGIAAVLVAKVVVRIGGDIVWSEEKEIKMLGPEELAASEVGEYIANGVFNADLTNPIELPHGRTLTIECSFVVNSVGLKRGGLKLITMQLSSQYEQGSKTFVRAEGTMLYEAEKLTGHRTL
jgi:hypothetical protein